MKNCILLLCFTLLGKFVLAQEFELFSVKTAYYSPQKIKDSTVDGEIGFKELGIQFTIPQIFNNYNTILSHTFQYAYLVSDTKLNINDVFKENSPSFHTIGYKLNLNQKINDKWRLNIGLAPTLASDFQEGLSKDDFLMQANAIAMRVKNRNFNYGFGLAFTTRFGRKLLFPIAVLNHKTTKRTLKIVFPNQFYLMYNTISKNFYYGFNAQLNGALFNNHNDNALVNNVIDKVGYSRLNLGAAIELRLKGVMYLRTSGGLSMARKLELIDGKNEVIDRTPKNGPFFNLGIVFYPQRKVKKTTEESR